MSIVHVQDFTELFISSGTTGSVTATVGAGNALVAMTTDQSSFHETMTVSDGVNTWTQNKFQGAGASNYAAAIHSAPNCGGGSTTVTLTGSGTATYRMRVVEFSGCASSAILAAADGDANDTVTAPHASVAGISTTGPAVFLASYVFDRDPSASGPTGWTNIGSGSVQVRNVYKIFSAATSGERAAMTSSPANYDAVIAAYKEAPAATVKHRRTFSPIGTRTGVRQLQG